jgi:hypothetical protein
MYEDYLEYLFKYSLKLLLMKRKNTEASRKEQSSVIQDDDKCRKDTTTLTEDFDVDDKTEDSAVVATQIQQNVMPDIDTQHAADTSADAIRSSSGAEVASESSEEPEYSFSELHFNFTVFLLWLSVTLLNVPCVLVWAHNYR